MSQQGGRATGHEDDWWGQLYDDSTEDTGPAGAVDSLDDRFASASGAVDAGTGPEDASVAAASGGGGPAPHGAGPSPRGDGRLPSYGGELGSLPDDGRSDPSGRGADAHAVAQPALPPAPPLPPPARESARAEARPAPPTYPPSTLPAAVPAAPATSRPLPPPVPARPLDRSPYPPPPSPFAPAPGPPRPATPQAAPRVEEPPPAPGYVGSGPPTYDAEPTALPPADPDRLADLVADTVLDGAQYGPCTIRAVSVRGDSARFRGEPRRDALLTARFGVGDQALVLVAMATGARATPGAHRAAAEACRWIGRAVGRSHVRLAEDIRGARRGELKSGLHRLTDRSLGKLRASAAEQGVDPEEYAASLRCLLLPADPQCRTRVFFGVGDGGLFRLRDGEWQDIEPSVADAAGASVVGFGSTPAETSRGDRLTMDLGIPTPPSPYDPVPEPPREPFRFRASVARPGDTLLMCTGGLADPLRGEPGLTDHLSARWSGAVPPGLAAFLADTQVRVKGYADDRTAAAVWEA
ncbi:protein phosphatase 2C domain-containing protein [Streptomyces sp. NPDC005423]|uniref:protein phosphatase 2C domain-containing protein n=1 Tax=Streptomyces sp. NPDC005423 TaxID=3155343 RepID=UPI0033A7B9DA